MTYRLDYYEPALLPGKDGWESGGNEPIIFSSCLAITTLCQNGLFYKAVQISCDCFPKTVIFFLTTFLEDSSQFPRL